MRSVGHGRIWRHTPSHHQPYWDKVVERLQDSPCKRIILIAPGWPIMPWFWDPVAMSSKIPLSLPNLPNLLTQPFNQIPHRNLTSLNLDARLLEPQHSRSRASLRRWQQELRLLKRGSTRSVYEAKWTIVTSGASLIRWTSGYPCKVSCWLPYVPYEDRKLQPSTIDGYSSAIADKLGNSPFNISKDKISLVSWTVSTETGPKAGGAYPPGTSHWSCTSWIRFRLNQSRRPPCSIWPSRRYSSWPLGRANTEVRFILGKQKNIRHQSDWSTVSPYPLPSFLSKNQLAKRVQTVWPQ